MLLADGDARLRRKTRCRRQRPLLTGRRLRWRLAARRKTGELSGRPDRHLLAPRARRPAARVSRILPGRDGRLRWARHRGQHDHVPAVRTRNLLATQRAVDLKQPAAVRTRELHRNHENASPGPFDHVFPSQQCTSIRSVLPLPIATEGERRTRVRTRWTAARPPAVRAHSHDPQLPAAGFVRCPGRPARCRGPPASLYFSR